MPKTLGQRSKMRVVIKNIIIVSVVSVFQYCYGQSNKITPEAWVADIDYLESNVTQTFPDFDSNPGSKKFLQEITSLKEGLASKSEMEILFGIQKALGVLGDDGCNILPFQEAISTKLLPISMYPFEDGWYICDAKNKSLIGEQITHLDGVAIAEVFEKMKWYLNADNAFYRQRLFGAYGLIPDLLRVSGIKGSESMVSVHLASGKTVSVDAEGLSEYSKLNRKLPNDGYFLLSQTDRENENYWFEYFPESNTLFVQFQQISNNKKGPSFSKFIGLIKEEIKSGKAQKIILDVRYGGGGNGFKLKSLTDLLRESDQINQKGNLIILTSKTTKGTLLELSSILRLNTKAVLIGEPTGEGPNTVGDVKYVELPNSKIKVSLTKIFWPTSWSFDQRTTLEPDVAIAYSHELYQKGEDPWLTKATTYEVEEEKKVLDGQLIEALVGSYKINGRKVSIKKEYGKLWIQMNRKIKSFFEINTELFSEQEGVLGTNIKNVKLHYSKSEDGEIYPSTLEWKSNMLPIER